MDKPRDATALRDFMGKGGIDENEGYLNDGSSDGIRSVPRGSA